MLFDDVCIPCLNSAKHEYKYTRQLIKLDSFRPLSKCTVAEHYSEIVTPLRWSAWQEALAQHPDMQFADYLVQGIKHGFRIGFNHATHSTKSRPGNMRSATDNPGPVREYLDKELAAKRVVEVTGPDIALIHTSKFGVIPKSNQVGKWRLILDLSSPLGVSVNNGIDKELCSMRYTTLDNAVKAIVALGSGTLLAKIDVKEAYRNIPVHPDDRHLLGMSWNHRTYIDCQLPFGLRSAPAIFSAVDDALEWVVRTKGISYCMHYLDDFLTLGPADSTACQDNLSLLRDTCNDLGVLLKLEKVEGPATSLVFLGIELDTIKGTLSLPAAKLLQYNAELVAWSARKAAKQRELLSIIGKLSHACKVVRTGRIFLRRMIQTAYSVERLDHWVRLNKEFQSDLWWWLSFLELWNGRGKFKSQLREVQWIHMSSDASGSWGCGAVWGQQWIQCRWEVSWAEVNIAAKELLPIVLACAIWGKLWRHQAVRAKCDNMAVVAVWTAQSSKHDLIMHLLRCLHFICAFIEIDLHVEHIKGADNIIADAVSRNLLQVLHKEAPYLDPLPVVIPPAL